MSDVVTVVVVYAALAVKAKAVVLLMFFVTTVFMFFKFMFICQKRNMVIANFLRLISWGLGFELRSRDSR